MGKDRLAAFRDGVIAILITIMVLELRIPHGADMAALVGVAPSFLTYVMSFVYLAIYWNNHHHLLDTVGRVDGLILWANSHLLFWLSLIPAATAWMGKKPSGSTAHRCLWCRTVDACDRLLPPAEGNHTQTRHALRAGQGAWQRH
jgi:uncharacterized membrane protein